MAVRQYIGARYVTKIYENTVDPSTAEWEAGVTYEPLTLVTYMNGSYLSKKTVPGSVGDPSANPVYWVQTGFYNGQIASLQAQIDAVNAAVTVINGDLADKELTSTAAGTYFPGSIFMNAASQICRAIININPGDTLMEGVNYVVTNIGNSLNDAVYTIKSDFADQELTNIAVGTYFPGSIFMNAGFQICQATTNINPGDTLTENVNYIVTDIGTAINDIVYKDEHFLTNTTTLFNGTVSPGSNIVLSGNINNYRMIKILDANTEYEGSIEINNYYHTSGTYPSILLSAVAYNAGASVMVMSDIALTSTDGLNYSCVRSAQINLDSTGVTYFGTNESVSVLIVGYN